MRDGKLSPKEKAFALAYVELNEGKAAAIKAGYNLKRAEITASELVRKSKVQAEIQRLQAKCEERSLVTRERIERELELIAFSDPADVMRWNESGIDLIPSVDLPRNKRAIIKSLSHTVTGTGMSMEVKLCGKIDALKELSKLKGLYPDEGTGEAVKLIFTFGDGEKSGDNS